MVVNITYIIIYRNIFCYCLFGYETSGVDGKGAVVLAGTGAVAVAAGSFVNIFGYVFSSDTFVYIQLILIYF